ncbi:MAG: glycosidase [Bacteroidota bacterium]|jgi:4-O-beta-D-mannosyl-D-glucose phosphorylase
MSKQFNERLQQIRSSHAALLATKNEALVYNGLVTRYKHPVLTAAHVPIEWRYDCNPNANPFLMERFGINAVFNAGAMFWNGKYILAARVEGYDRKSFFAIAESANGIDGFTFWDTPILLPETSEPDTNVYDMRLVQHEDGWIYGLFCTERRQKGVPDADQSSAVAQCGIARTKDLKTWERLPDLITRSNQQRNVVLHPTFVNGMYALYTRPQDGFIEAGSGGGIAIGYTKDIGHAVIEEETLIDKRVYHTINESKNGLGPAPIYTADGWLHLAHGVRNTASGLRYVLYLFMTDVQEIGKIIYKPAGYFMAPEGEERVGDVSNVLFSNGWINREDGSVAIYYASSDTRMHVATTTIEQLVDYVKNTPADGYTSANAVSRVMQIIRGNS